MSIVEVARLAGVSHSTVSRVINNHPRVLPETAKAVRLAMAELQYTPPERRPGPKLGARLSASKRTTIAFLVLRTPESRATLGFEKLMLGVSDGASRCDAKMVYQEITDLETLPALLAEVPADGLLLHGALPPPSISEQLKRYPTVWLMGNRRRPDWGDQVIPDTYEIGSKAARYLLSRGHRKLAFLNVDPAHWPFEMAKLGFANTAETAGAGWAAVEPDRPEMSTGRRDTHALAEKLVKRFLKLSDPPSGVFVADDMQVAIVQPALQQAGVEVGPGKVEIISCNNERPYLMGLVPMPAEIDICVQAIGFCGVERLLWRLDNRDIAERIVTAVEPMVIDPSGKPYTWPATAETAP